MTKATEIAKRLICWLAEYPIQILSKNEPINIQGRNFFPPINTEAMAIPAGINIGEAYPGGRANISPSFPLMT
jgi:hypothetical protein